jgi:hypothetical protein
MPSIAASWSNVAWPASLPLGRRPAGVLLAAKPPPVHHHKQHGGGPSNRFPVHVGVSVADCAHKESGRSSNIVARPFTRLAQTNSPSRTCARGPSPLAAKKTPRLALGVLGGAGKALRSQIWVVTVVSLCARAPSECPSHGSGANRHKFGGNRSRHAWRTDRPNSGTTSETRRAITPPSSTPTVSMI